MPKFTKGKSGNPAGRPKGGKNRSTEELRNIIRRFIGCNLKNLQADLNELESKDRLTVLIRLLGFILPAPVDELERLSDEDLDRLIVKLKKERLHVA